MAFFATLSCERMHLIPIRTAIVRKGDSIYRFLDKAIVSMKEGDILCVTSKVLALCQRRTIRIEEKEAYISRTAKKIIQTPWAKIALMDDGWCINAGVDESNADGEIILLPKDPMGSARRIRKYLAKRFGLKRIGVLITDTRSVPLRVGTIGRAIGWSGFSPIRSYIGKEDLYGRMSRVTQSNVTDALAASAVLIMGEGNERVPLVLLRHAPVEYRAKNSFSPSDMHLSEHRDIFRFIFQNGRAFREKKNRRARL